ncbi:hypothetical protein [Nocardioides stalactiti]|uniref:hypothetical protein n=1 Tax=Nocardioides stalactiti TaxID=2755356 RepID=UPI0015FFB3E6|nr:hypothetical protein [Nocardioides stalactiti]
MDGAGWGRSPVTRRGVVLAGGVVAAGALASGPGSRMQVLDALWARAAIFGDVRVDRIRRASDMLVANVVFGGLDLTKIGADWYMVAGASPGYLGIMLPGQSLGEHVEAGQKPPVAAELAQPTILGFRVPAATRIPYDLDAILDLTRFDPVYGTVANGLGTSIEAPYRLVIRPHQGLGWLNDTAPKRLTSGRVAANELWHTRLAGYNLFGDGKPDQRSDLLKVVQVTENKVANIVAPLSFANRADIKKNANVSSPVVSPQSGLVIQAPVEADLVLLSPVGASLDLHGSWPGAGMIGWDHRATLGRDNYVRVEKVGFLAPYRHPATIIKETYRVVRKFSPSSTRAGDTEALLVQTFTLIVREPDADTSLLALRKVNGVTKGLPFPFTKVRCTQRRTAGLAATADLESNGGVPMVPDVGGNRPLRLPFVGTDHNGNEVPFTSAVYFVPQENAHTAPPYTAAMAWNLTDPTKNLGPETRAAVVPKVDTAVAPEHPDHRGLTTLPLVGMEVTITQAPGQFPPWQPRAADIRADLPGMSALSGNAGGAVRHFYAGPYLTNQNNFGGVVLRLAPTASGADGDPPQVDDKNTGGLLPMPSYQGMSSKAGAVMASAPGSLDSLATGIPTPSQLFGQIQLIGTLTIAELVPERLGSAGIDDALPAIPGVTHDIRNGRVYVDMDLKLPLKFYRFPKTGQQLLAFKPSDEPLQIKAHAESGAGGPAELSVDARLRKVALEFAGIVAIPIVELRAQWQSGAKPVFSFEIKNTQFLGPLEFLQPLSDFVALGAAESDDTAGGGGSSGGGSQPAGPLSSTAGTLVAAPGLGQAGNGVDAYIDDVGLHLVADFGVPDLKLGVFTLTGMNFGIGVDLPFGGGLEVHAYFASFANPFMVTYSGAGGTGFVDVLISEGGRQVIKASIGVAATAGIDLVVASGSLSINVGLMLTIENSKEKGVDLALAAYFRISGSVSVPFICTVSVVFELILEFRPGLNGKPSKLTGTARFLLKVDTLICDEEVEARISKTFKGGLPGVPLSDGGDPFGSSVAGRTPRPVMAGADRVIEDDPESPTFRTTHTASTWQAYAAAFAAS